MSNFHTWPLPSYALTQTDISQWLTTNIKGHKSFYNLQKEILDQQQRERNDTSFRGVCMFCTEEFHGNRFAILQLSEMLWANLSSLPFIKGLFFKLGLEQTSTLHQIITHLSLYFVVCLSLSWVFIQPYIYLRMVFKNPRSVLPSPRLHDISLPRLSEVFFLV